MESAPSMIDLATQKGSVASAAMVAAQAQTGFVRMAEGATVRCDLICERRGNAPGLGRRIADLPRRGQP
jgi:hypothetical protein